MTEAVFSVQLLGPNHDGVAFDCGVPILTSYLQQYARQDLDRGIATPCVLVPSTNPIEIAGFYTLAATAVKLTALPTETIKKLPKYPLVPATLLGRLAISLTHRGKGLGEYLLIDALKRSLEASRVVGSAAVIVDAKDESGVRFYERYGFKPLPEQKFRSFSCDESARKALEYSRRDRGGGSASGRARQSCSRDGREGVRAQGSDGEPESFRTLNPRHNPTQKTLNRLLKPFRLKLSLAPISDRPKRRHAA